jgi:hypothetical protein
VASTPSLKKRTKKNSPKETIGGKPIKKHSKIDIYNNL